jgi:hypothetical protein
MGEMRMGKMRKRNFLIWFLFGLLNVPMITYAESPDELYKFHPIFVLREEYSDNIKLAPTNRQSDWVTTAGLGLRYSTLPATSEIPGMILLPTATVQPSGIDLRYLANFTFYAHNSDANYLGHNGKLEAWYSFDPHLTVRISEYFIRSQDTREMDYTQGALPGQLLYGSAPGLFPYIRNVLQPSVEYRFGQENLLTLLYRNNIYQTQNPGLSDIQENFINPFFTYWFNIQNGITLEYGFLKGDYEKYPSVTGHNARGRYTFRFNPRTSIFGEYLYMKREYGSPGVPYEIQNPSVGIEHRFTPALRGLVQVGYYWKNLEGAGAGATSVNAPSFNAGLTYERERTRYMLSLRAGYRENLFNPYTLGLGFSRYYGGYAAINHDLSPRITLVANGGVDKYEYTDGSGRTDWIWRVGGVASYRVLRWLNISLIYYHQEQLSNTGPRNEWMENRVILNFNVTI